MNGDYLVIDKKVLPEVYEKVIATKKILQEGKVKEITEATKLAGISRSVYYKYKDYILEPSEMAGGRKAVLSMMLAHEPGVLSALLQQISERGGSVLTITQSLPIHKKASVTISLDVSAMPGSLTQLLEAVEKTPGVENARLVAVE